MSSTIQSPLISYKIYELGFLCSEARWKIGPSGISLRAGRDRTVSEETQFWSSKNCAFQVQTWWLFDPIVVERAE